MANLTRLSLMIAAVVAADFAVTTPSFAMDPFADAKPVSVETLQSERAGFFTAGGQEFSFAATLETAVNGAVALTTTLQLQDNGSVQQQTVINPNLSAALSVTSVSSNGAPTTVIPVNGGAQLSAVTGLDLSGVQGAGIVIKSASGITAILNTIGSNQLQNLVINTANNQTITQNTAVTLTLPGLGASDAGGIMSGLGFALQAARLSAAH
jgi:hypothetical protein